MTRLDTAIKDHILDGIQNIESNYEVHDCVAACSLSTYVRK